MGMAFQVAPALVVFISPLPYAMTGPPLKWIR